MKRKHSTHWAVTAATATLALILLAPDSAYASSMGGDVIVTGLKRAGQFFKEIVGYIGALAFIGAGAFLWFNGDMRGAIEKATNVVLGTGMAAGGVAIMTAIFGLSGATIDPQPYRSASYEQTPSDEAIDEHVGAPAFGDSNAK